VVSASGTGLGVDESVKDGCFSGLGGGYQPQHVNIAGHDFCLVKASDAGAGNRYYSYWYSLPLTNTDKILVLSFTIHSVVCENYENPNQCIAFDEARDTVVPQKIVATVSVFAPAANLKPAGLSFETQTINKVTKGYEIDFKYPLAQGGDTKVVKNINQTINDFVSTTTKVFMSYVNPQGNYPVPGPFSLQSNYAIPYVSDQLVSLDFSGYEFTGGAHGLPLLGTFVFDLKTGQRLSLDDLFATQDYLKTLSGLAQADLKTRDISTDSGWIASGTAPDTINYKYYYLTHDALVLVFPPYQVAPYVSGVQEVAIPYGKITSLLKPEIKQALGLNSSS